MNPRTIAIGDIHGCSAALGALVEAIRPRPEDRVVTLGETRAIAEHGNPTSVAASE